MYFRHRSSLILHLDAAQAMFDTGIAAIELRNFKILLDESPVGGYPDGGIEGCYWMQDWLRREKDKFILDITALGKDEFQYSVRFDFAEVERK